MHNNVDEFRLTDQVHPSDEFSLEPVQVDSTPAPIQTELFLPQGNPEQPENSPQIELDGMAKPVFAIQIETGRTVQFQHAHSLLESLESQDIHVHYQCREGYCGSCRVTLLEGDVHYTSEPLAWLNDGDILPCCCIPKSNLKIKI